MTTHADPAHSGVPLHRDVAEGHLVRWIKDGVDRIGQRTAVLSGFYRKRANIEAEVYDQRRIDLLLVAWWVVLIVCYALAYYKLPYAWPVAIALSALRIVNITFWNLRIALIETGQTPLGASVHRVASTKRSLILGMVNFLELIIAFACLYAAFPSSVRLPDKEVATAGVYLYFSSITQLTIGYGDVTPLSWMRLIAVIQGLSGLALLTVTIGRFIALVRVEETGPR